MSEEQHQEQPPPSEAEDDSQQPGSTTGSNSSLKQSTGSKGSLNQTAESNPSLREEKNDEGSTASLNKEHDETGSAHPGSDAGSPQGSQTGSPEGSTSGSQASVREDDGGVTNADGIKETRADENCKDQAPVSEPEDFDPTVGNICAALHEVSESITMETGLLQETHLKEYNRTEHINSLVARMQYVCGFYTSVVDDLQMNMRSVRVTMDKMKIVIDEKIKTEDLSTFLKHRADIKPSEYETLEDKEILETASRTRLALGRANQRLADAAEKVKQLESQTADANEDLIRTRTELEASEKRAEEVKKAAEAKERAELEEKARQEEEQRKKEEEEKRLREEEEARQAELLKEAGTPEEAERRRVERERRDPKNWTPYIFSVDPGDVEIPIGCVIRAIEDSGLSREDFTVTSVSQLDGELHLNGSEELIGHIIHLEITADAEKLKLMDEPLSISIPHCAPRNTARENTVKCLDSNNEWKTLQPKEVVLDDIKEFKFVEVRLRESCTLAVVTRWKKDVFPLSKRSGKIVSSVDSRITLSYKKGTFSKSQSATLEVNPVELATVSDVKQRHIEECDSLFSSSAVVTMTLPTMGEFDRPVTVTVSIPPGPNAKAKRPKTAAPNANASQAKTETRPKSAMFASTVNKDDDDEDDEVHVLIFDNETQQWMYRISINENVTQSKNKDTVSILLSVPVYRFVVIRTKVEVPHPELEKMAELLYAYQFQRYVQFILRQNTEDAVDTIVQCVHISRTEKAFRKLDVDAFEQGPPASPESIIKEGQVMWLDFRGNIHQDRDDDEQPEQKVDQEEIQEVQEGDETDAESAEKKVEEPQEVKPENPLKSKVLRLAYNTHIRNKLGFFVTEIDKFAQKSLECYRGFVQVYTRGIINKSVPREDSEGRDTDSRSRSKNQAMKTIQVEGDILLCELLVNLAKPEQELSRPVCRTPLKIAAVNDPIDDGVLHNLATEIGEDWKRLASQLNVKQMRIQAILRNNASKDQETAIYDMLVTWAKRIPKSMNKTDMLCQALNFIGRADLVEELRDRENDYKQEKLQAAKESIMRKTFIKVAQNAQVTAQWKNLAKQLGLSSSDIDNVENKCTGMRERCYQALVSWRDTQGMESISVELLAKHLRRCRFKSMADQIQVSRELRKNSCY